MRWLGYSTEIFCLGTYRQKLYGNNLNRSWLHSKNEEGLDVRDQIAMKALEDCVSFLKNNSNGIALFDGTNSNKVRRDRVHKYIKENIHNVKINYIESICDNEKMLEYNIQKSVKHLNDQFYKITKDEAHKNFCLKIKEYENQYETICSDELDGNIRFLKIFNAGKSLEVHKMEGHIASLAIQFLLNIRLDIGPIYIISPGYTENQDEILGLNPKLTDKGKKYAELVNRFFKNESKKWIQNEYKKCFLFFSPLAACSQVEQRLEFEDIECIRQSPFLLNRINYGDSDGMKIADLKNQYASNFKNTNQNSRDFRYPSGESYNDLVIRLEPFVMDILRIKEPIILICHHSIEKCLYSFFSKVDIDNTPEIQVERYELVKLIPLSSGYEEFRYNFDIENSKVKETRMDEVKIIGTIGKNDVFR